MCYMNTRPDMWHGKPEREDRTTSYQTLEAAPPKRTPSIWPKIALLLALMVGFLWAMKSMLGW